MTKRGSFLVPFLGVLAYFHVLLTFAVVYLGVRASVDSHQRLYGSLAGFIAALSVAIPYLVVIVALGLLREIAANTASLDQAHT
jgi:hypothetical protein